MFVLIVLGLSDSGLLTHSFGTVPMGIFRGTIRICDEQSRSHSSLAGPTVYQHVTDSSIVFPIRKKARP